MKTERIGNSEELVGRVINIIFRKENVQRSAFWLEKFEHYNKLPVGTSRERKLAGNFVTKTAEELLQNPQDISIADETWGRREARENHVQESKEPFSELVRKKRLGLIKEKWEDVTPGQLAQLVRMYANKDESQESSRKFAGDLLRNYFKGPKSRSQRIDAYYNFVSGVLDLAEDDEAFLEGMKIALHATEDILPRNPSLVEQAVLLNMPYDEEEQDFKKLIISKYIINQASRECLRDFNNYHGVNGKFLATDEKVKREWGKKKERVTKKIGRAAAREFYDVMMDFFRTSQEPLSKERKQALMGTWPFNIAFDETDPLNQKFQELFSQKDNLLNRSTK